MSKSLSVAAFVIVAILAYSILWTDNLPRTREQAENLSNLTPASGKLAIGGPFELTDHFGEPFTDENLKGKMHLVFFGFLNCPDVCPMTLMNISNVMDQLDEETQKRLAPLFITVDPERDTAIKMQIYLTNFHSSIVGLTGTPEQVKQAADAYKVYFSKSDPDENGNYNVNHSGLIYFIDEDGNYITHFRHDDRETKLLKAIEDAMADI